MPRYAFLGLLDEFPPVRDAIEQAGVVVESVSTNDDVLHVALDQAVSRDDLTPLDPPLEG
jgi:hypothetical protein